MTNAAATSPFAAVQGDLPWTLWSSKMPLSMLSTKEQTESRVLNPQIEEPSSIPETLSAPINATPFVQHNQYNAVLARIKNATQHSGRFSAWNA